VVTPPLRLGLIGCGRAAERLWLAAFRAVHEVRLAAAVDPQADRRAALSRQTPGCRMLERLEDLALGRDVDAVVVTSPPETHFDLARRALEAGCPVLVEKPLASTVAQAIELDRLRRSTGTPLMVGLNRRWWAPVRALRERLSHRGSGECRAELVFVTNAAEWGAVAGVPDLLDDLGTHQLDLLRFLFDREIASVSARHTAASTVEMEVKLADGSSARCRIGHDGSSTESIFVTGGSLVAWIHGGSDRLSPAAGSVRATLDFADRALHKMTGRRSAMRRSFEHQLRAFAGAVRSRAEPSPDAADGLAAVRAVAATRASLARGGTPVTP
jgi:predicted dehydrogenase